MTEPNQPKPAVTSRLDAEQRHALVIPGLGGFGNRFTTRDITYHPVPYNFATLPNPISWRIQLRFGAPAPRIVVGLDLYGDTILGRGNQGPYSPDIDLTNLNAIDLGISRRHALFRPTVTQLFLIDLESTNGTFVNAIPVGRGMAQVIRTGDTIALAGLSFVIEIIHSPRTAQAREVNTKPFHSPDSDQRGALEVGKHEEAPIADDLNPLLAGEETLLLHQIKSIRPEDLPDWGNHHAD